MIGKVSPFLFGLLLLGFFESASASGEAPPAYVDRLVEKAVSLELYKDRYWHILMHYRKKGFRIKSAIDDPAFFISKIGKNDPRAELEAAIRFCFAEDGGMTDDNVCEYFARYTWLKEMLHVDMDRVPYFSCDPVLNVHPRSAVIVFPSYYMNNPASMFGHTFINIRTDFESDPLANTVNYAARTDETNGLVFAFRGIVGLYKGYYSVMPYYRKIQEYNDMDKRDIWEYELNLTPEELERMVFHIRELEGKYTDYFFFDENCSYNLLFLLEAARPSLHLTDRFSLTVIPIDTVKAMEEEGLVQSVKFRPAKVTTIRRKADQLDGKGMGYVRGLLDHTLPLERFAAMELKDGEKAVILDVVSEYVQYQYLKKEIDEHVYRKQLLSLLSVRSKLGKVEAGGPTRLPRRPDTVHGSSLIGLAQGTVSGHPYTEITYRPALNEISDPDFSDTDGMQIQFLNTRVRYNHDDHDSLKLEELDIVSVWSLASRDDLFTPMSWKFAGGMKRAWVEDGERALAAFVKGGTGVAWYHRLPGLLYGMVIGEVNAAHDLPDDVRIGAGGEIGVLRRLWGPVKCHVWGSVMRFYPDEKTWQHEAGLSFRLRLSKNCHLTVDGSLRKAYGDTTGSVQGGLNVYF